MMEIVGCPSVVPSLDERLAGALASFPEVAAAWLFGSVARGDERPDSDLDLGLVFRRRRETAVDHHRQIRALAGEAEDLAGGRLIDVVVLESQGPIFCHRVLSEARLVYEADRERRIDFESTTYVRYLDFLPTWELATRHALGGLRRLLDRER